MKKLNHWSGPFINVGKEHDGYYSILDNATTASLAKVNTHGGHFAMKDTATLFALADHAPHECIDPMCPGNVNRKKLIIFDKIIELLKNS